MKRIKNILTLVTLCASYVLLAQEAQISDSTKLDKKTYYEQRALEDAKFEQQFTAKSKEEEKAFWKEQKQYEKELKKRDREAYHAYMEGKRDAYREHYAHCDHHATIAIFITTTQRFIMTGIITTMKDTQEIVASTPALGL